MVFRGPVVVVAAERIARGETSKHHDFAKTSALVCMMVSLDERKRKGTMGLGWLVPS
jgi:hypothetical protein